MNTVRLLVDSTCGLAWASTMPAEAIENRMAISRHWAHATLRRVWIPARAEHSSSPACWQGIDCEVWNEDSQ